MENLFNNKLTVILNSALLLFANAAYCGKGGVGDGGGGFLESRFLRVARQSVQDLAINNFTWAHKRPIPILSLAQLFVFSEGPQVIVTSEPIFFNGIEKSAVTQNGTITLYKPDWEKITDSKEFRSMVLHELMRVAHVEDDDYKASEALELALESIDSFPAQNVSSLREVVMTPNLGRVAMCGYVLVSCGPAMQPEIWTNAIAELKPNQYYRGSCEGNYLFCPQ